jgi:hypothetical protein
VLFRAIVSCAWLTEEEDDESALCEEMAEEEFDGALCEEVAEEEFDGAPCEEVDEVEDDSKLCEEEDNSALCDALLFAVGVLFSCDGIRMDS